MSPARDPLATLLEPAARASRLAHLEVIPAREATTVPWPEWADPALVAGCRARGIERPWVHQVQAADSLWRGRHTVLATSTGSGKSLAAWLPAITAVRAHAATRAAAGGLGSIAARRRPTTVYISPTKALAADQLAGLETLLGSAGLRDVRAATCDGDTPFDERDWVRAHADLVLTNPDFLHFSLLPGHRRWDRLLRSLRFVVVDECHAYRGILGAHVALVLRRLLRLAHLAGARPTVLLASATTASPAATAARLVGVTEEDIDAVTQDASPAGRRRVAVWTPPPRDDGAPDDGNPSADVRPAGAGPSPAPVTGSPPDRTAANSRLALTAAPDDPTAPRRSVLAETADLLADLVAAGARTLAFTRARAAAEAVAQMAQEHLAEVDGTLPARVAAYRGGYLPEERRTLESGIRSGDLLALATTNALELGIDLSGLDAVLIAGWPGSRVSLWQQAGRSGRAGADGLAVLVAGTDPLDAYLRRHPEAIFGAPLEATAFDPANPYVLAPHLCAAAAEAPVRQDDLAAFGLTDGALLDELVRRGLLRHRRDGWYWNHSRPEDPSRLTDLRGAGGAAPVQVVESATGRLLGTVDAARADATVHAGAVYVHQGRSYLIEVLADDVALAHADATLGYRTRARTTTRVTFLDRSGEHESADVRFGFGPVELTSQVTNFARLRIPDMESLGVLPLEMPERRLRTKAVWWSLGPDSVARAGLAAADLPGALHAAEHAAIGLLPLVATCDPWDAGGVSTALHEETLQPTVVIYDGYPGGAGFAERGFAAAYAWLSATRSAIAACRCRNGCPGCVQSARCGSGNAPLDKAGALRVLDVLRLAHRAGPTDGL